MNRSSEHAGVWIVRAFAASAVLLGAGLASADLPPPPTPPQNPITEPKRVLGKMLFWDEQLSSSNTMACGTCHSPRGGSDTRRQRTPGLDNVFNTADDTFGSPGVIRADAQRNYKRDSDFAFAVQATPRNSMTYLMAAFSPSNFWDGRAQGPFIDPISGQPLFGQGGPLELQVLGPPQSDVEMGHEGRDWEQIVTKLATARPLALASNIPSDVQSALTPGVTYPQLFQAAFGGNQVTPARVAMAIATYERTLIANQTPWDRFIAGEPNALTPAQLNGRNIFNGPGRCDVCHTAPTFTNSTFRNIGLRPIAEDSGRFGVTNNPADRGRFKVPSLRNVGLRNSFMHNGMFTTLAGVVDFYARAANAPQQFLDNRDPLMPVIDVPPPARNNLIDFLQNGLTDPRVAAETFPFDRPTLYSQRSADQPVILPGGSAGSGGFVPRIIASDPAMLGNSEFRIGLFDGRGGAHAQVLMSRQPPVNGRLSFAEATPFRLIGGSANGAGVDTLHWPILNYGQFAGRTYYFQWAVLDSEAAGGVAFSDIAQVTLFCPSGGCPPACVADFNLDGLVFPDDLSEYITCFFLHVMGAAPCSSADVNGDGLVFPDDLSEFITAFFLGCHQG